MAQSAKAYGKCIENKAATIAKIEKELRDGKAFLADEKAIKKLAKELNSAGYFSSDGELTATEMERSARVFVTNQLEQVETRLASARAKQDCSSPGAIRECIDNKDSVIRAANEAIRESNQMLSKPDKLIELANQMIYSRGLPRNLTRQEKLALAKEFATQTASKYENRLIAVKQQADCAIYEYPFALNPNDFAKYLNSVDWKDGKKKTFFKLSKCDSSFSTDYRQYWCDYGYVKVVDPLGERVCEIQTRSGFIGHAVFFSDGDVSHGALIPCKETR